MLQSKIEIKNQIKSIEDEQRKDKAILHKSHYDYNERYLEWLNKTCEVRKISRWQFQIETDSPDYMPELGDIQNRCRERKFKLFIMNCAWYAVKHRLDKSKLKTYKEEIRKRTVNVDWFDSFWFLVQKKIDEWTANILRELDEREKIAK